KIIFYIAKNLKKRSRTMGNREDYKKKLEAISTIEDSQIKTPHHIPVDVYIQEADTLYHWVQSDKEALAVVGLSWELVEDLPLRCKALIEAEARWQTQRKTRKKSSHQWDKLSPLAYDLRNRLLTDFRFAFRKHPDLITTVRGISKGESQPKSVQDLNDLSVLGKANSRLLEAIHFDMSLLDKAAQTAREMAVLLAEINKYKQKRSEAKKIRDQAYTHLKEAVDEIRLTGQYVFRQNKDRFTGYRSKYIRQLTIKQRGKPKKKGVEKNVDR
ncbi:hypothetical protein ACFLRT_01785, partial [Acidobacteriota bacterium]